MYISTQTIYDILERHDAYPEFVSKYAEPRYTNPENGIILANWNYVPRRIYDWLQSHGWDCEYEDEWLSHDDKAYRTSPTYWGWKPYYIIEDGKVIGGDEIENDKETTRWYLFEYLANNSERANLFNIDLEKWGFEKVNKQEFEIGWFEGMNDDPSQILGWLLEKEPEGTFVFSDFEKSQFYVRFSVYRLKEE